MKRLLLLTLLASAALVAPAQAAVFTQTGDITINDDAPASPSPSTIGVSSQWGPITDVNVTLTDLDHTSPDDLDVLLVSPRGDSVILMSDACGITDLVNVDLTFDHQAAAAIGDSTSCAAGGSFSPADHPTSSDTWPVDFPGPHTTSLTDFNGENPLGTWQLFVRDDAGLDTGVIDAWSLDITTGPFVAKLPADGNNGPSDPSPITEVVTGSAGVITDVDLDITGLYHQHPEDLDILLEGPNGETVMLMSDVCGSFDLTDFHWRWSDEAAAEMPTGGTANVCNAVNHRPTNEGAADLITGAPPGAPGTALSDFDGIDPDGTWKLYIQDDGAGDAGFLTGEVTLIFTLRATPARFVTSAVTAAEGSSSSITVERSGSAIPTAGTVRVRTAAGTATAGSDFTPIDQVLSFAPGEVTKTVELATLANAAGEPAETLSLALSEPDGDAQVGSPGTVAVTIPADPQPPAPVTTTLPAPPAQTITVQGTPPPAAPPAAAPAAAFTAANAARLPSNRGCKRRGSRLVLTPLEPRGVELSGTEVTVNRRRVARLAGDRADDPVSIRVGARRMNVVLTLVAADGRRVSVSRAYRPCATRRRA